MTTLVINLIVEMTCGKPLTAVEKNIIVKDLAKGIIQEAVTRILDHDVRTAQLFGISCTKEDAE